MEEPTSTTFECEATDPGTKLGITPSGWPPGPVLVNKVDENSWAWENGVRVGDTLVRCNGAIVDDLEKQDLIAFMKTRPVALTFSRVQASLAPEAEKPREPAANAESAEAKVGEPGVEKPSDAAEEAEGAEPERARPLEEEAKLRPEASEKAPETVQASTESLQAWNMLVAASNDGCLGKVMNEMSESSEALVLSASKKQCQALFSLARADGRLDKALSQVSLEVLDTAVEREDFTASLTGKRVLHVKGFGSGFKDPTASQSALDDKQVRESVDAMMRFKPDFLVVDGDPWGSGFQRYIKAFVDARCNSNGPTPRLIWAKNVALVKSNGGRPASDEERGKRVRQAMEWAEHCISVIVLWFDADLISAKMDAVFGSGTALRLMQESDDKRGVIHILHYDAADWVPGMDHRLLKTIKSLEDPSRESRQFLEIYSFKKAAQGNVIFNVLDAPGPAAHGVVSFGGGENVVLEFASFYLNSGSGFDAGKAALYPHSRGQEEMDPELPRHVGSAFLQEETEPAVGPAVPDATSTGAEAAPAADGAASLNAGEELARAEQEVAAASAEKSSVEDDLATTGAPSSSPSAASSSAPAPLPQAVSSSFPSLGSATLQKAPQLSFWEGWLEKRGPTVNYRWLKRWCVLRSDCIEYYFDDSLRDQKGAVLFKENCKTIVFKEPGAPRDAVKHCTQRPYGFVVDPDPSSGKQRHVFYFDAGSAAGLESWMQAFTPCLEKLKAAVLVKTSSAIRASLYRTCSEASMRKGSG